jgi:polysaccharide deacetylase family protein (PEP-CTERM system associated)
VDPTLTNALTVDVEDYFHVHAFARVVDPKDWESYPSRVEVNTCRLLEIFAQQGIRATFFVLGWVAKKFPKLVLEISTAGHRVGCHGFAHKVIYAGTPGEFRNDVRMGKSAVEDALGGPVQSYRAPSYSVTAQTIWALDVLAEEGFDYDSSIFPVMHDNYGMPDAPRFPYLRSVKAGRFIKEFPPSTVRLFGFNCPVAGGGYFRLFPYGVTAWAVRRINEVEGQPALVYLHPWELDPDQPRIAAGWKSSFRHYNNLESTESKCRRLLKDFSWAPMEEVFPTALEKETTRGN